MRIVQFLPRTVLAEGGVVRAVLDLAEALASAGHQVEFLTRDDADWPEEWRRRDDAPRLRLLSGGSGALATGRGFPPEAVEAIRAADVVHLHTPWEPGNLGAARIASRAGVPYVLTVHGMLDDWAMAQKRWKKLAFLALAGRRLLARAAWVHCTAEGERAETAPRVPHDRVRVIPLIADLAGASSGLGRDHAGGATVVFLGRVVPGKGVDLLIRACAIVAQRRGDLRLIVAGPMDSAMRETLDRCSSACGMRDKVEYAGFVGGDEKRGLLMRADVAASLSAHENFGFTLVEAAACAAPVVTTRHVAIWKDLEDAGGAIIVDRTPEAAAEAIESLLSDPARARRMGEAGRAAMLRWLDPARVLGEYERMYADAGGVTR